MKKKKKSLTIVYCSQVPDGRGRSVPVGTVRTSGVGKDYRDGGHSETLSPVESGCGGVSEIRLRVSLQFVVGADAQLSDSTFRSR